MSITERIKSAYAKVDAMEKEFDQYRNNYSSDPRFLNDLKKEINSYFEENKGLYSVYNKEEDFNSKVDSITYGIASVFERTITDYFKKSDIENLKNISCVTPDNHDFKSEKYSVYNFLPKDVEKFLSVFSSYVKSHFKNDKNFEDINSYFSHVKKYFCVSDELNYKSVEELSYKSVEELNELNEKKYLVSSFEGSEF